MILKIISENGTVLGAVNVHENNENGDVSVIDTFHCEAVEADWDTLFGSNEAEIIVKINM